MTQLRTQLRLRGDFEVFLFHAGRFDQAAFDAFVRDPQAVDLADAGRLYRRIAKRNTITYTGVTAPLILLAQNTGTVALDYQLKQFVVGTNSTPPSRGDTALGAPVSSGAGGVKNLVDANRVLSAPTGELIVTATYGTGDANVAPALNLVEAGILLGNGTLFARQVNPPVPKSSAFVAAYTWRFGLTA